MSFMRAHPLLFRLPATRQKVADLIVASVMDVCSNSDSPLNAGLVYTAIF